MAQIVTITNPITGQPTQVDQLDHTAQEIDDAASRSLPGGYYDKWVSQLPGMNLLDNWYFPNPVDQRQWRVVKPNTTYYSDNTLATAAGTTSAYVNAYRYATGTASGVSYASFKLEDKDTAPTYYAAPENVVRGYTGAGYGPDRWKLEDITGKGVVLINDDWTVTVLNPEGNTDSIWWTQFRETDFNGEQYTVSLLVTASSGGLLYFGGNNLGTAIQTGLTSLTGIPTGNIAARIVVTPGNSVTMKAVALELGNHQTLAHQDENGNWVLNEIPDYGEQLARCQRFGGPIIDGVWQEAGIGVAYNSIHIAISIPWPVTVRAAGALIYQNLWLFDLSNASMLSIGNPEEIYVKCINPGEIVVHIKLSSSDLIQGHQYMLATNAGGGKLYLTADL